MHVYLPPKEKANGGAVLVCPGGGFSILAWDLEGTEVAEWLNSIGFAAIVVKYLAPTAHHGNNLTSKARTAEDRRPRDGRAACHEPHALEGRRMGP